MINLFLPARANGGDGSISRRTEDPGLFTTSGLSPLSDFWYTLVGKPTSSRVRVNDETALTYSAVWACTRILCGTLAGLPLNLAVREQDGAENIIREDRRNHLLDVAINEEMNAMMGRFQGAIQQVNGGNCYYEIERLDNGSNEHDGDIWAYWPIHRSRVKVRRGKAIRDADDWIIDIDQYKSGVDLYYEVKNNDKGKEKSVTIFDPREILHFPSGMSDDGISGKGVITYARESIGFGLATERYGAAWFGTGGVPRVAVTMKGKMTPDAKTNFRKEWKEIYGGSDGDKVALLTEGATLTPISISQDDAQFLETRGHNLEEMSRWYGVPTHMIQRFLKEGGNIEHISIEFLTFTMLPWCKLWTQELHTKTLTEDEQRTHFYRFDFEELLRMDAKTRSEYLRTVIQIGVKTPNEGRKMEGLNPYRDEGNSADKLYMQGAMVTIDKVGLVPNLPKPDTKESQQGKDAQGNPGIGGAMASEMGGAVALVQMVQASETRVIAAVSESLAVVVDSLRLEFSQKLIGVENTIEEGMKDIEVKSIPTIPRVQVVEVERKEGPDTRTPVLLAAAKVMLVDAADRVIKKECWAARQAAKSPGTFLGWLDKFYGEEYPKLFEKNFAAPCNVLMILGVPANVGQLAATGAAEGRNELLDLSGACGANELAERIDERMKEWENGGAVELAETVIKGAVTV